MCSGTASSVSYLSFCSRSQTKCVSPIKTVYKCERVSKCQDVRGSNVGSLCNYSHLLFQTIVEAPMRVHLCWWSCYDFKVNDVMRGVPLTLSAALISGRVVEREAQWYQGSNLQDDESNILQGLPYQLQEGFWLLWRYQVFPIYFFSFVQVWLGACKTWRR